MLTVFWTMQSWETQDFADALNARARLASPHSHPPSDIPSATRTVRILRLTDHVEKVDRR